jgi:hypothetical protein
MTDKATVIVWETSPCRGAAKLVHLAMAHRCNRAGDVDATVPQLAEMTGLDDGYVRRVVKVLTEAGIVAVARESAGRRPRQYRLVAPVAQASPPAIIEVVAPGTQANGSRSRGAPLMGSKPKTTRERRVQDVAELTLDVPASDGDSIGAIFDAWREATGHRRSVLSAARRKLIAARLKDYPADVLVAAVRGVVLDEWHVERGYDSIELVLRDCAHVERFARLHEKPPPSGRNRAMTSAMRVRQRMLDQERGQPVAPERRELEA